MFKALLGLAVGLAVLAWIASVAIFNTVIVPLQAILEVM